MTTNLRTLGKNEAKTVLSFREQGRSTVRAADVIELLGNESTARKVIRNLLRKGWLTRLVAGRYLFLPPEYGPENLGGKQRLGARVGSRRAFLRRLVGGRILPRLHHAETDDDFGGDTKATVSPHARR